MSKAEIKKAIRTASKAEAHLYSWGCIVDILEGSATPDRSGPRGRKAVQKVLKIAKGEISALLREHDAAVAIVLARTIGGSGSA